jgi:hypothetical protein
MQKSYLKRTLEQYDDELDEILETNDLNLYDRAAQVATIVKGVLDELYREAPKDWQENAIDLMPEIEKRVQEIRAMIAPTLRSSELTTEDED